MLRIHAALGALLVCWALPVPVRAADAWLEPAAFRVVPGDEQPLRLMVGRDGRAKAVARPARLERFWSVGPGGAAPLPGKPGVEPAATWTPSDEGVRVLAYQGTPAWVELSPAAFARLAREDALSGPPAAEPVRLTLSRSAKSLVQVGSNQEGFDRVCGLALELVPERSPFSLQPDAAGLRALPLRVLLEGRPLAGALVTASSLDAYEGERSARSDAAGRCTLELPSAGRWLLACVHLRPGLEYAPWDSHWASLTCELPGPTPRPRSSAQIFAAVLSRARASGALAQVLGAHHFRLERHYYDPQGTERAGEVQTNLMTYRLIDRPESFVVEVTVQPRGSRPFQFIWTLGRDGRFSSFHHDQTLRARREGQRLFLEGRPQPYDPATLPKMVGAFVLPLLHDQGLPPEVPFRDVTPGAELTRLKTLRTQRSDLEPSPGRRTFLTDEGRAEPTTRIVVDLGRRRIVDLRTVASVHPTAPGEPLRPDAVWQSVRLEPEEFERLRPGWGH